MEKLTKEQKEKIQQENEEKKEYLLSYKKYKQQAKRLEEHLEELRLNKISPSMILSDMPSAHSRKDLSDYMVKYEEIAGQIIKARKKAIERFSEVQRQIEQIEGENEKTILTLRYLKGCNWEKICEEIGYSWKQVHRIHVSALQNFKNIEDDIE